MESFSLTSPIYPGPAISTYQVRFLNMNWPGALIHIGWKDNLGNNYEHTYSGSKATQLMVGLNKANLTVKSLHKRIFEQLAADNLLNAGSITGAPD